MRCRHVPKPEQQEAEQQRQQVLHGSEASYTRRRLCRAVRGRMNQQLWRCEVTQRVLGCGSSWPRAEPHNVCMLLPITTQAFLLCVVVPAPKVWLVSACWAKGGAQKTEGGGGVGALSQCSSV